MTVSPTLVALLRTLFRHDRPEMVTPLQDEIFDQGSDVQLVETAASFIGDKLTFSVDGPSGVTIDPVTGVLSIPTDNAFDGEIVVVRATNAKGVAWSDFRVTVEVADEDAWIPAATSLRTSVTFDYGEGEETATFTFDGAYQCGQYCTGDWFVVAPNGLQVTQITPLSEVIDQLNTKGVTRSRMINGTMKNPRGANGWESLGIRRYTPAENVDPGNTGVPIPLVPGDTLVKSIGHTGDENNVTHWLERGMIRLLAPLTVVAEAPPEGAFRPPYIKQGPDLSVLPVRWRENQIRWELLPSRDVFLFFPSGAKERARKQALATWQVSNRVNTGNWNIVPCILSPYPDRHYRTYRTSLGTTIARCMSVVVGNDTQEYKRDYVVGMIQLGIDQIPAANWGKPSGSDLWDLGRLPPTVLAATLLPQAKVIRDAIHNPGAWQDIESFAVIDEEMILSDIAGSADGDVPGATYGQEGHGTWRGRTSPGRYERRPLDSGSYIRIQSECQQAAFAALLAIPAAHKVFPYEGVMRMNDRVANWSTVAGWTDSRVQYWINMRNAGFVYPALTPTTPERPQPPVLTATGTTITVTPDLKWRVPHGSAITQMDVRYRKISQTENDWTEVIDATDGTGTYDIISLDSATEYLVGVRYVNSVGAGAWSRNWSAQYKRGGGWIGESYVAGRVTTRI